MRTIKRWLGQHLDLKRDERGFGLRVWLAPVYVELYLDRPTHEISARVLYGEAA
jgi:hypothetical protein